MSMFCKPVFASCTRNYASAASAFNACYVLQGLRVPQDTDIHRPCRNYTDGALGTDFSSSRSVTFVMAFLQHTVKRQSRALSTKLISFCKAPSVNIYCTPSCDHQRLPCVRFRLGTLLELEEVCEV